MNEDFVTEGREFVVASFEDAKILRWKKPRAGCKNCMTHCELHNTYFIEDDEPCWACWNEFNKEESNGHD